MVHRDSRLGSFNMTKLVKRIFPFGYLVGETKDWNGIRQDVVQKFTNMSNLCLGTKQETECIKVETVLVKFNLYLECKCILKNNKRPT